MVKHIVLFKLADEAEGRSRTENALIIKEKLEALIEVIPVIRKIEVKLNLSEASDDNHDIILYSEFDSLDDVKTYAVHPEHLKIGAYISKVRTSRAAIDYEF